MRRLLAPLLGLALGLSLVLPVLAAGAMPDNPLARLGAGFVPTDCTQADCAPALRTELFSSDGSTGFSLLQSGDVNNAASAAGILKTLSVGRYNATLPTLTDTRYNALQVGSRGSLNVTLFAADSTSNAGFVGSSSDAVGGTTTLAVSAFCLGYNGSSHDRCRSGAFTASTTPTGVLNTLPLWQYKSTLPTYTDSQYGHPMMTAKGSAWSTLMSSGGNEVGINQPNSDARSTATLDLSTESYMYAFNGTNLVRVRVSSIGTGQLVATPPDYSYTHIAAGQATTVVKGSAGFLHAVCFNSAATATNVTTIYDNASTSGTVIAIPNAVAATVPNCITYDLTTTLGIVIITTTANGSDMTVSWR